MLWISIEHKLDKPIARIIVLLVAAALSSWLTTRVASSFIKGLLSDERVSISRDALAAATEDFPHSALIHARYAEAEVKSADRNLGRAEPHLLTAIRLSPWDYRLRLLLAEIEEAKGDSGAAQTSLRSAIELAPNNADVHWRLANLLVRAGKLSESISEFRFAVASDPVLMPATLELVAHVSAYDLSALRTIAGSEPEAQISLALFLAQQSRPHDAVTIFSEVDRHARLASSSSGLLLKSLIGSGYVERARNLWIDLVSAPSPNANDKPTSETIWNGSFESDIDRSMAHFDWRLGQSDYARITIAAPVAHSGSRSLRIGFAGRETTRLNSEIEQLIVVTPGIRYRLECYVQTEKLVTPQGPQIVVMSNKSGWIAATPPIAPGSSPWQRLTLDFTCTDSCALLVTIKRTPRFSYDDPTSGTVWLDDFKIYPISARP